MCIYVYIFIYLYMISYIHKTRWVRRGTTGVIYSYCLCRCLVTARCANVSPLLELPRLAAAASSATYPRVSLLAGRHCLCLRISKSCSGVFSAAATAADDDDDVRGFENLKTFFLKLIMNRFFCHFESPRVWAKLRGTARNINIPCA